MNLVDAAGPGRYRYHDLLRLFAREKVSELEVPTEPARALARLLALHHDTTRAATLAARPGYLTGPAEPLGPADQDRFRDADRARSWLDREHRNVTATLVQCAEQDGLDAEVMARTLHHIQWYLRARGHWYGWEQAARAVLAATVRTAAPAAELTARQHLGQLAMLRGDPGPAHDQLTQALALARATADRDAEGYALNRLGLLAHQQGDSLAAIPYHSQALAIFTDLDDRRGRWTAVTNIGKCYRELHQPRRALESLEAARALANELADPESQTVVLHHIACCQADLGNHDEAIAAHEECLTLIRQLGQREGEAYTLAELGRTHLAAGRPARATDHLRAAIDLFRELGDSNAIAVFRIDLGHAHRQAGGEQAALAAWTQALAFFQSRDAATADTIRQAMATAATPPGP
jgi:tetratricopeptide (TPR) repeat protein